MLRPSLLLTSVLVLVVAWSATAESAGLDARPSRHTPVPAGGLQEPDGKALYLKNCKQCHGVTGEPTKTAKRQYEKIAALNDEEFMKKLSSKTMLDLLQKGKGEMKGFTEKMTVPEMEAVVAYVRNLAKTGG